MYAKIDNPIHTNEIANDTILFTNIFLGSRKGRRIFNVVSLSRKTTLLNPPTMCIDCNQAIFLDSHWAIDLMLRRVIRTNDEYYGKRRITFPRCKRCFLTRYPRFTIAYSNCSCPKNSTSILCGLCIEQAWQGTWRGSRRPGFIPCPNPKCRGVWDRYLRIVDVKPNSNPEEFSDDSDSDNDIDIDSYASSEEDDAGQFMIFTLDP